MTVIRCAAVGALIFASSLHTFAQQQGATQIPRTGGLTARSTTPRLLPATRSNVLGSIQGNALNSTNGQMANATVRLRDARFGQILDTQITNQSGLFTFGGLDPGSYIVEMMANDSTILAASQVLNVNAGEAMSAVVKLPFRIPPFAGVLGNSTQTATSVVAEAAASGVMAVTTPGIAEPTCP